jgi:hypothetical protein
MTRASRLIAKLDEIGYYGQHNDYSDKEYDQDAGEYMAPFKDVQLPDKPRDAQTKVKKTKSEEPGKKVS